MPTDEQRCQSRERKERLSARARELQDIVHRFHRAAEANPDLWHGSAAAIQALQAAQELCSVQHELDLTHSRDRRRAIAFRHAASPRGEADMPDMPPPEDTLRADLHEAVEGVDYYVTRLRATGSAPELVRRADVDRRSRLRWLLEALAHVWPEPARDIEQAWSTMTPHADAPAHNRLCRWERQTGDWLLVFLEPRLPGASETPSHDPH